jgi:hypothetical protein
VVVEYLATDTGRRRDLLSQNEHAVLLSEAQVSPSGRVPFQDNYSENWADAALTASASYPALGPFL